MASAAPGAAPRGAGVSGPAGTTAASGDPFLRRSGEPLPSALGTPRLWRVLLPWAVAALAMAAAVAAITVAYRVISARAPSLEVLSVPDGAAVYLSGASLGEVTPTHIPDVGEEGETVAVEVHLDGFRPYRESVTLHAGTNRQVFMLQPLRLRLHVETVPSGCQVYVDGVLRGRAPLDVDGLSPGEEVELRAIQEGYWPARRMVRMPEASTPDEAVDRVRLELRPLVREPDPRGP
ncbi:MAG: PEGA domain-containing protein [Sandaracinaceae bacterium]